MKAPDDEDGTRDSAWLAAVTVIDSAQKVFVKGAEPPGELRPLVEPMNGLSAALKAEPRDEAEALRCARDLVADEAAINWACQREMPREIREFGATLVWLSRLLDA